MAGRRGAALVATALALGACTGSSGGDPEPTASTTTTIAPEPEVDDGVLRLGALVPQDDTGFSTAYVTAVQDAVDAIDAAGGVLGSDVELVFEDEGATSVTAAQAIEALVDGGSEDGVDAIIGPVSSLTAIGALDEAVEAGIVTCSPTASAISLDDFPDDGLFFRTIPTDSLQAVAIAQEARDSGASKVAIVHVDDAYGRPYADAVASELARDTSIEVTTIPVAVGDDDLSDDLGALLDAQAAIALGGGTDTARFLEAIAARESASLEAVVVNDAARSPGNAPIVSELPSGFRQLITGVAPQITRRPVEGEPAPLPFEPQVVDCVNLVALAAVQGGSDEPGVIASQMVSVSEGGRTCRDFAGCADQLAGGLQIDYQGATSITDLGPDGDPDRARFDVFVFDADGEDVYDDRTVTVG